MYRLFAVKFFFTDRLPGVNFVIIENKSVPHYQTIPPILKLTCGDYT